MVGCSKNRKAGCLSDSNCEWIVGKRCYNSGMVKKTKANVKKATKTKTKPTLKSLEGHNVVFSGFRDAAFASEIQSKGAKVAARVSSKTTIVVYEKTEKNASKLEEMKKNKMTLLTVKAMAKKFSLTMPEVLPKAKPKAKPVKTKAEKTVKPKAKAEKTVKAKAPKKTKAASFSQIKDASGSIMSKSAFPVKFSESKTIIYREKFSIAQILRIAQKSVVSDHEKGEIRKLYGAIWYSSSKDMFMMMSRVKSETDPKNYDYVGVEFKFDANNKIEYNASHPVIIANVSKKDLLIPAGDGSRKKMFDIKSVEPMIKEEYDDDIVLLTMN